MSDIRVVLSIGYGRLHLISTAKGLADVGCKVKLVCGWIPKQPDGWLVRLCSKVIGRDLSFGMKKRVICLPRVTVCATAWIDFLDQGFRLIDRKLFHNRFHGRVASWGWRVFGWRSKAFMRKGDAIFHCRSGAGQGGAIARARELGMKVVVDHSIAHPAYMERHLRPEYEKNGAIFDLGMDSPFWQQIVKDCEEADVVQVNSFFVRDTFLEQGFPAEKIRVVYLGEREDFFGLRKPRCEERRLKLLFTGGFVFRKGCEYILEACKILKERGIDYEMDIVGDHSGSRSIISRYEKDGLPLTFHGQKLQDELKEFLSAADVYVFPSLAEGCAQSGMEAMAAGLCVVGTRESGFPISDGETGFIVPTKNAVAIADKIEWLASHRAEIDRIGANAAKLIMVNYTWRKYSENTLALYESLLQGKDERSRV